MSGRDPAADTARLRGILPPGRWSRVDVVAETGSTNADLAARARAGEPGDQVLVAYHQTSGRGRLDRTWTAPPGASVAVSVSVRPPADAPIGWSWLPLLTGLAVRQGVRAVAGLDPELKWPNDVLVGGRKLAGILAEMVTTGNGPACVVGCGLNVAMTADELPVPTATSLAIERPDTPVDPVALIAAVLDRWAGAYGEWLDGRVISLRHDYLAHCGTVGQEVVVTRRGSVPVHGLALGVDTDGRLLVRTPGGVQPVAAGDVHHVR